MDCDQDFPQAFLLVLDVQSTKQEDDYQATLEQAAPNVMVLRPV
jgi:hypothetical protein